MALSIAQDFNLLDAGVGIDRHRLRRQIYRLHPRYLKLECITKPQIEAIPRRILPEFLVVGFHHYAFTDVEVGTDSPYAFIWSGSNIQTGISIRRVEFLKAHKWC